jgi:hypothetical protein
MAIRKTLLAVTIPSNRQIPLPEYRDPAAIPVVAAPPFDKDTCDKFDTTEMPDYNSTTDDKLKARMRARGMYMRGRRKKPHFIKALEKCELPERRQRVL